MYIERFLEKKVMKYLEQREIIAIVGARQCGKTTLMKHVFDKLKNALFISFEDRDALELFTLDVKAFIELYVKDVDFLFIDEFQYAVGGGKQLKYIYDNYNTKIIISGSSATDLSVQSIKFLVGRIFIFNLYPLSFEEYLNYMDKKLFKLYSRKLSKPVIERVNKYYDEFITYGGYPRVALTSDREEKVEVLKNIYNTYLLKEIKEILQLPDDFKLIKLIRLLALQLGGIVNYNELSSITGFDYHDLLKHLNVLKKTFICLESRPFFTNKKKEIVKAPKIFFLDNGFRNFIIKNFQRLSNRADLGELNENFIASELSKQNIELKYWRTKAKAEVDFIIELSGKVIPLEVKSSLMKSKVTRSFMNFLEEYKPENGFIFSKNYVGKKQLRNTKIHFKPLFSIHKIVKKLSSS